MLVLNLPQWNAELPRLDVDKEDNKIPFVFLYLLLVTALTDFINNLHEEYSQNYCFLIDYSHIFYKEKDKHELILSINQIFKILHTYKTYLSYCDRFINSLQLPTLV